MRNSRFTYLVLTLGMVAAACGGDNPLVSGSSQPPDAEAATSNSVTTEPATVVSTTEQPPYLGDTPEEIANSGAVLLDVEFEQDEDACYYDPLPEPQIRVVTFSPTDLRITYPDADEEWGLAGRYERAGPNEFIGSWTTSDGDSLTSLLEVTPTGFVTIYQGTRAGDTEAFCTIVSTWTRVGESTDGIVAAPGEETSRNQAGPIRPDAVVASDDLGLVVAGELIVVLQPGSPPEDAAALAERLGGEVVGSIPALAAYQIAIIEQDEASLTAAVTAASADPAVVLAAPHSIGLLRADPPPPPCLPGEAEMLSGRAGWAYRAIGLDRAYQLLRVSGIDPSKVLVGVIDTGLKRTEDMSGQVRIEGLSEGDEFPESNPYTGANRIHEHGTDVVSVIGADWSNGGMMGVAGGLGNDLSIVVSNAVTEIDEDGNEVAYTVSNAELAEYGLELPEDMTDTIGFSEYKMWVSIMDMLNSEPHPTVINLSVGSAHDPKDRDIASSSMTSLMYDHYLKQLAEQWPDVLFVAAATNDGWTHTGTWDAVAGKKLPNVITVASMDRNANTYGTAEGDGEVTLAAPGQGVATTFHNGVLHTRTGSSFATPQVTAAAALIRSINPDLTAAQVKEIIVTSADTQYKGNMIDAASGGLVLRVDQAVASALRSKLGSDFDPQQMLDDLGVEVRWQQTDISTFDITADIKAVTGGATTIEAVPSGPGDIEGLWTQTLAQPGPVTWRAELYDLDQPLYVKVTRFDSGDCRRLTLTSESPLSGTYAGLFGVVAEGYGVVGEIPFEITVAEDLSLTTHLVGTINAMGGVYTTDFVCNGRVNPDGSAECSGDGVASFTVGGQTQTRTSTITGTGQITDDVFDFTIVGLTGPEYGTAFKVYP